MAFVLTDHGHAVQLCGKKKLARFEDSGCDLYFTCKFLISKALSSIDSPDEDFDFQISPQEKENRADSSQVRERTGNETTGSRP
jgi:hypothetical protein